MRVLVTGSAGFIGSVLAIRLRERADTVICIDSHSDCSDLAIKSARLERHNVHDNYTHVRSDLVDRLTVQRWFTEQQPT